MGQCTVRYSLPITDTELDYLNRSVSIKKLIEKWPNFQKRKHQAQKFSLVHLPSLLEQIILIAHKIFQKVEANSCWCQNYNTITSKDIQRKQNYLISHKCLYKKPHKILTNLIKWWIKDHTPWLCGICLIMAKLHRHLKNNPSIQQSKEENSCSYQ